MKKFVTAILLSLLSALCVFAFTACSGGAEKETEVKTTVTEEEWKAAIAVLTEGDTSFKSEWNYEFKGDDGGEEVLYIVELDTSNKSCHFYYTYKQDNENFEYNNYYWHDAGGKAYSAEFIPDSEKVEKRSCDENAYDEIVDMYVGGYAGIEVLRQCNLADKYGEFEYDEESKAYAATLDLDEKSTDLVLKYEDGKLVYLYAQLDADGGKLTYALNYSYDVKVTVPQNILDMPLS